MRKLLIVFIVSLLTLGFVFLKGNFWFTEEVNIKKELPVEIFEKYWNLSLEGKFEKTNLLVGYAPKIFYECYFDTSKKCQEKKANNLDDQVTSNENFVVADNHSSQDFTFSLIKDRIPKGIFEENWKSYSIQDQWIYDNEARIRVLINSENAKFKRDVLLYKTDEGWKIFRFLDINDREAFAPIK